MKHRVLLIGTVIFAGVCFLASCKPQLNQDCAYGFKEAVVYNSGSPAVDGCGWMIGIDTVSYHPVNLEVSDQIDGMPVLVRYEIDPQIFYCGRGGVAYQSLRLLDIRKRGEEVRFLKEEEWEKYSMDPFRMDTAFIDGDWLVVRVFYSGGCKEHDFHLWKLPPNALDPPPVELALSHDAHGDMCEAYMQRTRVFSLIPLREPGKHETNILLRGSPEMSAYFGKFTYRY